MKSVLIIGMGRFGRHLSEKFFELKNEVLAVDMEEERVNAVLPYVTNALIGDATNEQFVAALGVRNFDICVVAIGNNFQASLETTLLLKELGAKFVVARASRDVHAKFLMRNGADKVIYTEKEMAYRVAVKYSLDNIFDYIELTPEYSIFEISPPESWIGKTILQKAIATKYHISILAVKHNDRIEPLPKPTYAFTGQETLIVLGNGEDVKRLSHY